MAHFIVSDNQPARESAPLAEAGFSTACRPRELCYNSFFGRYGGRVDSSSRLIPGAVAPRSGVYRVHHYAHRMPHFVTVTVGTVLPECKRCGDKVRFAPMIAAEPISNDVDFLEQDFAA